MEEQVVGFDLNAMEEQAAGFNLQEWNEWFHALLESGTPEQHAACQQQVDAIINRRAVAQAVSMNESAPELPAINEPTSCEDAILVARAKEAINAAVVSMGAWSPPCLFAAEQRLARIAAKAAADCLKLLIPLQQSQLCKFASLTVRNLLVQRVCYADADNGQSAFGIEPSDSVLSDKRLVDAFGYDHLEKEVRSQLHHAYAKRTGYEGFRSGFAALAIRRGSEERPEPRQRRRRVTDLVEGGLLEYPDPPMYELYDPLH